MSIAVRRTVPSASPLASPRDAIAAAQRLARRANALSTMHLAALVLVVLVGGILASIITTTDPLWWQLHFSQLGTFHDVSGALFNTTLKVGGVLVAVYAVRVRRDLRRLGRRAGRRGAPTVAWFCLTVIGVNLALVGCVPLNTNKDLHDKVAGMMVLGFAALLITTPILLHRLPRRLGLSTALVFVFLFAGAWLFVTATINLALFEVIAFAAMFGWSGIFTLSLAGAARATAAPVGATAPAATAVRPASDRVRRPRTPRALRTLRPTVGVRVRLTAAGGTRTVSPAACRVPAPFAAWTTATTTTATPHAATRRVRSPRRRLGLVSADRAVLAGSAGARPRPRPLVRGHRPTSALRDARRDALGLPRRGCTASEAPAGSGTSTTPARRSRRRPAAAR